MLWGAKGGRALLCLPQCIPRRICSQKKRPPGDLTRKPPQCPRPQRHTQDEAAGTARCSGPTPPAVSLHPIRAPKTPVMTYGIKEARPLGAGRRTAGSPVWEWINDHWHASAPHLAPIHPPLRATHPSRAIDRKTVFLFVNRLGERIDWCTCID